jgi:hypothetical protein
MKKKTYINFIPVDNSGRKTLIFDVYACASAMCLGQVRYFTRWRIYVFFPLDGTVYDANCLFEIARFCDGLKQVKAHDA